jgi:predicted CxxxxCH...CXXCH cytochrome family protein
MKWVVIMVLLVAACAEQRERPVCADCSTTVHPPGWTTPGSDAFHGKDLERRGWDFALCQGCHGQDFAGKPGAPTCLGCHQKGPTACDTCHGNPPATGAHAAHGAQALPCTECHVVPQTWDEPGHILDENRAPIRSPRVTFGALANRDTVPSRRTAPAAWDADRGTCANVYCHGGILGDAAASAAQPVWNGGPSQVACGGCHGAPPASHAQSECAMCHPNAGAGTARHIDGKIDIGDNSGTCSACHGDAQSPAPPRGLHGETASTTIAVGAHRAHLFGTRVREPLACSECHRVPTAVGDPGHLDSALPADVVFGPLATARGAQPRWDRTTATCTGVYCHGPITPSWMGGPSETVYCGACHGLPPSDSSHTPAMQVTDCATCHPNSVGPFGNILVGNGKHMNGVVDAP